MKRLFSIEAALSVAVLDQRLANITEFMQLLPHLHEQITLL